MKDLVFKYYSDENSYAAENIRNNQLCFSNVKAFNDPFEFSSIFSRFNESEYGKLTDVEKDLIRNINTYLLPEWELSLQEKQRFHYHVACFSDCPTNPLMWSYYSNNHKGFCVSYKKSDIRQFDNVTFDKVNYASRKPETSEDLIKNLYNTFFYKHESWIHENEWRAVCNADIQAECDCTYLKDKDTVLWTNPDSMVNYASKSYTLKELRPQAIYFGVNCSFETIDIICRSIDSSQCKVYKLRLDADDEYKLVIRDDKKWLYLPIT